MTIPNGINFLHASVTGMVFVINALWSNDINFDSFCLTQGLIIVHKIDLPLQIL